MIYYNIYQVSEIIGELHTKVQYWLYHSYIPTSIKGHKQGRGRKFTKNDIHLIYLFKYLLSIGISPQLSSSIISNMYYEKDSIYYNSKGWVKFRINSKSHIVVNISSLYKGINRSIEHFERRKETNEKSKE